MATATIASTNVLDQIIAAGLFDHCVAMQHDDHCLRFTLTDAGRKALARDERFAHGSLSGLHADVGDHRADYRSYNGTFGSGSLQIVFDKKTGNAYADIDKYNPYQDVVRWVGHAFGEVVPNWFKRRRKSRKGDGL